MIGSATAFYLVASDRGDVKDPEIKIFEVPDPPTTLARDND